MAQGRDWSLECNAGGAELNRGRSLEWGGAQSRGWSQTQGGAHLRVEPGVGGAEDAGIKWRPSPAQ